jgi:cell division protein ZipA
VQADSSQAPDQPEFRLEPPPKPASEKATPPGSLILLLHVVSTDEPFDGSTVVQAAGKCGLEPGEMEIFHRHLEPEAPGGALFSMANMVKPGTFPFGAMAEFTSPGLALFSQADGSPDDPGRLEEMLATARCLADELGGQIQDEKRNALTSATEQRLRERVMELVVRGLER